MTDYVLRASSQMVMYDGFETVGVATIDETGFDLRSQGRFQDGTEWCLVDAGERMIPTGNTVQDPFGNDRPEMAVEPNTYYTVVRWNGGATMPPIPLGVEIIWSSARAPDSMEPLPEYPAGLPRFA